jgi:hypothetical protein
MKLTRKVRQILDWYESDNPGTKGNLARILMHGKLGGTGRMVILPVDQGFEHGPARSFAPNPDAYDPRYHFRPGDRCRPERLCRAARPHRGRRRHLRRRHPDHPEGQQLQQPVHHQGPGGDRDGGRTRCGLAARPSASPSIPAANTSSR